MFAVKLLKNRQYPLELPYGAEVKHGDMLVVLTDRGEEAAQAFLVPPETAKILEQKKVQKIQALRVMTAADLQEYENIKNMNEEGYKNCLNLIKQHGLNMNLVQCSYTFDKRKVTFYYTAPERVDFRGLLKDLTKTSLVEVSSTK